MVVNILSYQHRSKVMADKMNLPVIFKNKVLTQGVAWLSFYKKCAAVPFCKEGVLAAGANPSLARALTVVRRLSNAH